MIVFSVTTTVSREARQPVLIRPWLLSSGKASLRNVSEILLNGRIGIHNLAYSGATAGLECHMRSLPQKYSNGFQKRSDFKTGRCLRFQLTVGHTCICVCVHLVAQSSPSLCNPMDCSPSGSSVRGDSPGKDTAAGCHALLQGIFLTQGWNSGLPHCRRILLHVYQYKLSYWFRTTVQTPPNPKHCNRLSQKYRKIS